MNLSRIKESLLLVVAVLFFSSCAEPPVQSEWKLLFNGNNLDNWEIFIGSSLGPDFDSLAEAATPEKVYSVVEENGTSVIRISGEVNAALATTQAFENYHLRLIYRWGDTVYSRRNSGLLYHSFGDFGAAFGTWMPNIELQLMHDNLGDTYLMENTACEIEAVQNEETGQFVYTPGAELMQFGEHANGRLIRKRTQAEKPLGEWNVVDLYCFGTTAVHVVNGETVLVNQNTGYVQDGEIMPLTGGRIQIQSEGAELFIKSVELRKIETLPTEVLL